MFYGNADLNGLPWEGLVKRFRDRLGYKTFDTLDEYGNAFFSFIDADKKLIPVNDEENDMLAQIGHAANKLCESICTDRMVTDAMATRNPAAVHAAYTSVFNERLSAVMTLPISHHFASPTFAGFFAKHASLILNAASVIPLRFGLQLPAASMAALIVESIQRDHARVLIKTGIVVAGFAGEDYFPGFSHFDCFGKIFGKIAFDKNPAFVIIGRKTDGGWIEPFAQSSMSKTFTLGAGPDIINVATWEAEASLRSLAANIGAAAGGVNIPGVDGMIRAELNKFKDKIAYVQSETHRKPLLRVIESLPIDEMAALAETLVSLESLKEKFSRPTESVGGPIDVAVITRSEGLVWIRRKHFFHADFNVKFIERQRQRMALLESVDAEARGVTNEQSN
jgi:hypothetical protein